MNPGDKIRDYILEERIGLGGVGEVWRASHVRLQKKVAIKCILPHLCREVDIYRRFEREATATAKLEHPHIVSIFDFFTFEDQAILVMAFIDGGSLRDRLDKIGKFSLPDAFNISRGILSALDYAHQRGVVHRDVKPSNIILALDSHPYLVDFGIALELGKTRVTKFGNSIGTPEYMSPEQIRGEVVTHSTDVYSFGCVLYEMLSGHPPFGNTGEDGNADFTIMERHTKNLPTPLSKLNPNVDKKTEAVVMRAMEKNRYDRFAGCAEMSKSMFDNAVHPILQEPKPLPVQKKMKIALYILALITLISIAGWVFTYSKKRDQTGSDQLIQKIATLENDKANLKREIQNYEKKIETLETNIRDLKLKLILENKGK